VAARQEAALPEAVVLRQAVVPPAGWRSAGGGAPAGAGGAPAGVVHPRAMAGGGPRGRSSGRRAGGAPAVVPQ